MSNRENEYFMCMEKACSYLHILLKKIHHFKNCILDCKEKNKNFHLLNLNYYYRIFIFPAHDEHWSSGPIPVKLQTSTFFFFLRTKKKEIQEFDSDHYQ
jgi:hypothetical protein